MSSTKIHILNVGHGSCTLIEHASGHVTMIDINNGSDIDETSFEEIASQLGNSQFDQLVGTILSENRQSFLESKGYDIELTNPIDYLQKNIPGNSIWRYIQSHPDLDHMRGLVALKNAGYQILNFWDTEHSKDPEFHRSGDDAEWAEYQRLASGVSNRALKLETGSKGAFFNQDEFGNPPGDGLYLLAPIPAITKEENEKDTPNFNNLSYVLAMVFGGRTVIFGGDAENKVWETLHEALGDSLKCDVLIAPHHGRESAFHNEAVKAMSPEYTIVSVGKKPSTDATNSYRRHSDHVWSTRWRGNITIEIHSNGYMTVTPQYARRQADSNQQLIGSRVSY